MGGGNTPVVHLHYMKMKFIVKEQKNTIPKKKRRKKATCRKSLTRHSTVAVEGLTLAIHIRQRGAGFKGGGGFIQSETRRCSSEVLKIQPRESNFETQSPGV